MTGQMRTKHVVINFTHTLANILKTILFYTQPLYWFLSLEHKTVFLQSNDISTERSTKAEQCQQPAVTSHTLSCTLAKSLFCFSGHWSGLNSTVMRSTNKGGEKMLSANA